MESLGKIFEMKMPDLYILDRRPIREDFVRADIWCEYKSPSELDELDKWGMPRQECTQALVEAAEQSNLNPFYSIPNTRVFAPREFLLVGVEAFNPTLSKWEDGCVALVDGTVTTLTIFRDDNGEIDLYRSPASDEESLCALSDYLGIVPEGTVHINIRHKNSMKGVELPNYVEIPSGKDSSDDPQ